MKEAPTARIFALPRRRALVISLASLIAWSAWELVNPRPHPFRDLRNGFFTDHFSHLNAARLFPRVGLDLWRRSASSMLRPLSRAEHDALPPDLLAVGRGDLFAVPGWPAEKPLAVNWAAWPRFYPPGDLLLFAPLAALYHYSGLSFAGANLLAILLCLLLGHVALYVALRESEGEPLALLSLLLFYFPLVHWSLEGFYDAAAVVPLILCAKLLRDRRGIEAVLAFCAAAAIHFRAFFFAPLAVVAAALVLRDRQWRLWGRRGWGMALASLLLATASLGPYLLLQPSLNQLPIENPVSLAQAIARPRLLALLAVAAIAAAAQARARAWMELLLVGWVAFALTTLHQTQVWHDLLLVAWLAFPAFAAADRLRAVQARIWFVVCAGVFVFHESPVPSWLAQIL